MMDVQLLDFVQKGFSLPCGESIELLYYCPVVRWGRRSKLGGQWPGRTNSGLQCQFFCPFELHTKMYVVLVVDSRIEMCAMVNEVGQSWVLMLVDITMFETSILLERSHGVEEIIRERVQLVHCVDYSRYAVFTFTNNVYDIFQVQLIDFGLHLTLSQYNRIFVIVP